jgi:hypothetical protein
MLWLCEEGASCNTSPPAPQHTTQQGWQGWRCVARCSSSSVVVARLVDVVSLFFCLAFWSEWEPRIFSDRLTRTKGPRSVGPKSEFKREPQLPLYQKIFSQNSFF